MRTANDADCAECLPRLKLTLCKKRHSSSGPRPLNNNGIVQTASFCLHELLLTSQRNECQTMLTATRSWLIVQRFTREGRRTRNSVTNANVSTSAPCLTLVVHSMAIAN